MFLSGLHVSPLYDSAHYLNFLCICVNLERSSCYLTYFSAMYARRFLTGFKKMNKSSSIACTVTITGLGIQSAAVETILNFQRIYCGFYPYVSETIKCLKKRRGNFKTKIYLSSKFFEEICNVKTDHIQINWPAA